MRKQETSKSNQINVVPFFFLLSCQLICGIIHLSYRDLPNCRSWWSASMVPRGSNPVYFFPIVSIDLPVTRNSFYRPGLNHSDATVYRHCWPLLLPPKISGSVLARCVAIEDATARTTRGGRNVLMRIVQKGFSKQWKKNNHFVEFLS